MKNFILTITRDTIPYVKGLRPLAGSVAACIVMQQLDYWFKNYADGFYKFLEPCEHKDYRNGDSWTEELGMSSDEFRTAFDKIGTRHTSKTAFLAAADKFNGKFYCSYFDKKQGTTWYFRNHDVVDAALTGLVSGSVERPSTVDGKRQLLGQTNPIPVDGKRQLQKPAKPIPRTSTESTAKNTQRKQQQRVASNDVDAFDSIESSEPQSDTQTDHITQKLQALGVTLKVARELATSSPAECLRQIELLPHRPQVKNAAPLLAAAIRDAYAAPAGYEETPVVVTLSEAETAAREKKRQAESKRREDAAHRVLESFPTAYRKTLEKEKHDVLEYVSRVHANELAAEMRR